MVNSRYNFVRCMRINTHTLQQRKWNVRKQPSQWRENTHNLYRVQQYTLLRSMWYLTVSGGCVHQWRECRYWDRLIIHNSQYPHNTHHHQKSDKVYWHKWPHLLQVTWQVVCLIQEDARKHDQQTHDKDKVKVKLVRKQSKAHEGHGHVGYGLSVQLDNVV